MYQIPCHRVVCRYIINVSAYILNNISIQYNSTIRLYSIIGAVSLMRKVSIDQRSRGSRAVQNRTVVES